MEEICAICKTVNDEELCKPRQLGVKAINRASRERNDNVSVKLGDFVHVKCRKNYINKWYIQASNLRNNDETTRCTRSSSSFDFRENCFICACPVTKREIQQKLASSVASRYREIDKTIIAEIANRGYDEWSLEVFGRVQYISDLHAADAQYHRVCYSNFKSGKDVPKKYRLIEDPDGSTNRKRGRPKNETLDDAYQQVLLYLQEKESNDEQITIPELVQYMSKFVPDDDCYSRVYMKKRILEDYEGKVMISSVDGREDVVTFVSSAAKILLDFNQKRKKQQETDAEKIQIIKTAAEIIRNDIKALENNNHDYPNTAQIENCKDIIPDSLFYFLSNMITLKDSFLLKCSIGQAIIQSVRPRTILSPMQISLAVMLHRHFGSRYLIDTLNKLGFCSSYSEVQNFLNCAAKQHGINFGDLNDSASLHFISDNVDHNTNTLDGLNTFHGLGSIACITPLNRNHSDLIIRRSTASSQDVIEAGKIEINYFKFKHKLDGKKFFKVLQPVTSLDNTKTLGNLWQIAWLVKPLKPIWNEFMKKTHHGTYPGRSAIHFLPMIDLKATDYSCLYSSMLFVQSLARNYSRDVVLTFDQPLFWKTMEIKTHEQLNGNFNDIVITLGTFHACMSFLGSVGHLMMGSGLKSVLEIIYAEHTVPHILTGKAYSRAVRGHLIISGVLWTLLMIKVNNIDINDDMDSLDFASSFHDRMINISSLSLLSNMIDDILQNTITVEDCLLSEDLNEIISKVEAFKQEHNEDKTTRLWLMYLDMVSIFCKIIKAERTGNWLLHREALAGMLPFYASSGHHLYAKSVYLYLQSMEELKNTNPKVHDLFSNGYHVIRRTDEYWAGLSPDLVIEQELMRTLKTTGGVTRGRGIDELQRAKYILSTPSCAAIKSAFETLTNVQYQTSDQHKGLNKASITRDYTDAIKVLEYLIERNPFENKLDLVNIDTGEVGDKNVNVYDAKTLGEMTIKKMIGEPVFTYSFQRKQMAVTMQAKSSVAIDGEIVPVDNQLLFQRLSLLAKRDDLDLESSFEYELSTYPAALFDKDNLMRVANKSKLADALWKLAGNPQTEIPTVRSYVLDGGSLLQKISWKKGDTFEQICQYYVDYILSKYGKNTKIVFDGYPTQPTTKDTVHFRRTKGKKSIRVKFNLNSRLSITKDKFLLCNENKHSFIEVLTEYMSSRNICATQADADADYLVVKTALIPSLSPNVVLIGEDTDLLVLLLFHWNKDVGHNIFFTTEKNVKNKKIWDIQRVKDIIPQNITNCLLSIHSFLGFDTVSRIFSVSKGDDSLQKVINNENILNQFTKFIDLNDKSCIADAGETIMRFFYGKHEEIPINNLRFNIFSRKSSTSLNAVPPESLPPTYDATKQHSFRAYYQTQIWKGTKTLNPLEWGWKVMNDKMMPIPTEKPPAPRALLKIFRCGCKTGCKTSICTCKKHGLKCTQVCKECRGVSCTNAQEEIKES